MVKSSEMSGSFAKDGSLGVVPTEFLNGNLNTDDRTNKGDDSQSSNSNDEEISNSELGLAEDHFSLPEGHFGHSSIEELEMAIEHCKEIILEAPEKSERRRNLVKKLINLRMKLQEIKEGPVIVAEDLLIVLGHKFEKKQMERHKVKRVCEKCNGNIWGVLHAWYQCQECGYSVHGKCLNLITRVCASVKVSKNPNYIIDICPETGLSVQNYRCAECRSPLMNKTQFVEPRLCDYNGQYYCHNCHWNSLVIVPARVLHNWDMQPRKVCRASKQFLNLMKSKAILNIQKINPRLFNFVEELGMVKKLREEILVMKNYFLSCKYALEAKLLLQLSCRQHFVDSANMYSIQDLVDTQSGILLEFLNVVHSTFATHIKVDCEVCRGKGYICELCNSGSVIFPFDDDTTTCSQCSTVLHTECYYRKVQTCPRCQRMDVKAKATDKITHD